MKSSLPIDIVNEGDWEGFCLLTLLAEELDEFVTPRNLVHHCLDLRQDVQEDCLCNILCEWESYYDRTSRKSCLIA